MEDLANTKIGVIGLGYVGLPLAVEFGQKYKTIGFDIDEERLKELRSGHDRTRELELEKLSSAQHLNFTNRIEDLQSCNVYIVTVPTPINLHKQPNLDPLLSASRNIGKVLKPGDTVIYESTVFPGATEEICVPVLEETSGLKFNKEFSCGYSPERINPGDKKHTLTSIKKVTSGSNLDAAIFIDRLYASIISAGTYMATSIKVAEASKVIENTQRDVNIALINELALIFNKLGIDTEEVLTAAETKWNFLPFRPGLVGGHCIGVDPYYLTHKAQEIGYHPEIILSGRRLNDSMGRYVTSQLIKCMLNSGIKVKGSRALVLGLTFKENCPDLRNSKVIDIINELESYGVQTDCYDPWCDPSEAEFKFSIPLVSQPSKSSYDCVVIAVAHKQFVDWGEETIRTFCTSDGIIYDLKYVLPKNAVELRL